MPYLLEPRRVAILVELVCVVLISFASGYLRITQPQDFVWESTPLGMLFSFNPHLLSFQNGCFFAGLFSQHWDYAGIFLGIYILEMTLYYWFFPREAPQEKRLVVPLTLNFLTHPVIFFLIPCLISNFFTGLLVGQLYAFVLEAVLFKYWAGVDWKRSIAASTCANFASWQIGSFLLSI